MILTPARGFLFVIPEDEIVPAAKEVGFSGKTEKFRLEEPYKFRVIAVGGPKPNHETGYPIVSEVEVGDVISSVNTNVTLRDKIEQTGFLLDGKQILVMDFLDVLGIWKDQPIENQDNIIVFSPVPNIG